MDNRFAPLTNKGKSVKIPNAVLEQRKLRNRYKYSYRTANNGNIENNSTIYVNTGVAHPHQVEEQFQKAIKQAQSMTDVFGPDFECDFQVNLVRRHNGEYMGYAFVDVTNPEFYYAILGFNLDGTERCIFVDDPTPIPPKKDVTTVISKSWADDDDDDIIFIHRPKIKIEQAPLLQLDKYEYDEQQRFHLQTDESHGPLPVSPAFITPGSKDGYDSQSLYVSEVPAIDYDFMYAIFARYARYDYHHEVYYPKIVIRKCNNTKGADTKTGIFAIVEYGTEMDARFALHMVQKIRANYNGDDITMPVRYAFKNRA